MRRSGPPSGKRVRPPARNPRSAAARRIAERNVVQLDPARQFRRHAARAHARSAPGDGQDSSKTSSIRNRLPLMAEEGRGLLHECVDRLDRAGEQGRKATRPPMVNAPSTIRKPPIPQHDRARSIRSGRNRAGVEEGGVTPRSRSALRTLAETLPARAKASSSRPPALIVSIVRMISMVPPFSLARSMASLRLRSSRWRRDQPQDEDIEESRRRC